MNALAALDIDTIGLAIDPLLPIIAARASSLWERLQCSNAGDSEVTDSLVQQRWERWQVIAGGENALTKRLAWSSLGRGQLSHALRAPAQVDLPAWIFTVAEIMDAARDPARAQTDRALRDEQPLPFQELLLPFLQVARARLRQRVADFNRFDECAIHDMERALLERLGRVCVSTFHLEFSNTLPFGESLLNSFADLSTVPRTRTRYHAFVQAQLNDSYRSLFLTYPVLARVIATVVEFWVEANAELIGRLNNDVDVIAQTFGAPAARVVDVQMSLSDAHARGRSVALLTFADGSKLVYKPKEVALEHIFGTFIDWCNARNGLPALKSARVLDRGSYGWVEFIAHAPCETETEAHLFHERAGMLLAVLYTLRATDCHYENLVAHGAHPVLVDMETLLHHEPKLIDDSPLADEIEGVAVQTFWDSVLRTGLLPRWEISQDLGTAYDISGFGGAEGRSGPRRIAQWQAVNTDQVRLVDTEVPTPLGKNVPFFADAPLSPHDYQADIVRGFTQMYTFLRTHAQELLSANGPLARIQEQSVRFIFRPTRTYGAILEAALAPERLHDGADFSIELDHLARAFLVASERPVAFPILRAEHQAMHQLDVPLFQARAGDATLDVSETLRDYFRRSSLDDLRAQLEKLSDADLALQVALINGAFDAKIATVASRSGGAWKAERLPILTRDQFIEQARHIGLELSRRAIPEPDGGINWIGLDFIPHVERFQQQVLNNSLCDGRAGIALLLAALARVTGESGFGDLARNALRGLRRQIHSLDLDVQQQVARFNGIGGATGVPSMIYSLVKISQFLGDASLLDDAESMLDWITPDLITSDQYLDVMSGAAGAVLALAALHEASGSERSLSLARASAEHLLAKQGADPAHPFAWKTFWQQPLTGYSHGAAGAAYALHRLFHLCRDERYRAAADKAVAYEAALYSEMHGNWPDYRRSTSADDVSYVTRWCHGAPGIGLARIGSSRYVADHQIRIDIERALRTTAACELHAIDHLCCGNFGRIEVLLVASAQCGRQDWREIALLNATNVVHRAQGKGAYQLFPNLPSSVFNPGFLAGSAGIGYQLLRLAEPTLPSVLLWD